MQQRPRVNWYEVKAVLPVNRKPILLKGQRKGEDDSGLFFISGFYDKELDDVSENRPVFYDTTGRRIVEFVPTHWAYVESL
jgi:hypothetical protein